MVFLRNISINTLHNGDDDDKCRLCKQFDKALELIKISIPKLTKEQYIKGRDMLCVQIHFNICKEIGIKLDNDHWYDRVPESVETSDESKVTILWNQQMRTDRTIPNHKPDIIIRDNKKERACYWTT